jgi:RHS repeat-associated protein
VTYTYDGDGNRVKKSNGTLYWGAGPLAESDLSGTVQREYTYFNGGRVARLDLSNSSVHYYFSNHLGSTSVVTNATGSTPFDEDLDYYPYGGEVASSLENIAQNYKFNGKERDAESCSAGACLDNFGARFDASSLGRWMTPDWAVKPTAVPYAHYGNPQSLNLYSYVQNNPTTLGDPDGHLSGSEVADYLDSKIDAVVNYGINAAVANESSYDAAEDTFVFGATGDVAKSFTNLLRLGSDAGNLPSHAGSGDYLSTANDVAQEGARLVGIGALAAHVVEPGAAAGTEMQEPHPGVTEPYKRPSNATTPEQRASVQGKPCVKCGESGSKMFAGHKTDLVKEYYKTGKIDKAKMRDPNSVQSECPTCSNRSGADAARYSKEMKKKLNR